MMFPLDSVRYSPDGKRIVTVAHRTIKIWIVETEEEVQSIVANGLVWSAN